jgi:predicted XRE-type DNA-binding protein
MLSEFKGKNMSNWPSREELEQVNKRLSKSIASKPLPKDASNVDRVRYRLCEKFVIYKNSENISQRELASKIGINEALMSKILHYHFEEFTIDRLLRYLSEIYPDIDLKIGKAS